MFRKTLTILSLIGLLLSVGLWGASYFRVVWPVKFQNYLLLMGGNICWAHGFTYGDVTGPTLGGFEGFETMMLPGSHSIPPGGQVYNIPLWIPTVSFAAMFWWSFLPFHRRRKRKKLGLCITCGYDLRGSKDRCPECGEAFEK